MLWFARIPIDSEIDNAAVSSDAQFVSFLRNSNGQIHLIDPMSPFCLLFDSTMSWKRKRDSVSTMSIQIQGIPSPALPAYRKCAAPQNIWGPGVCGQRAICVAIWVMPHAQRTA